LFERVERGRSGEHARERDIEHAANDVGLRPERLHVDIRPGEGERLEAGKRDQCGSTRGKQAGKRGGQVE
jgi:hypothetical protein